MRGPALSSDGYGASLLSVWLVIKAPGGGFEKLFQAHQFWQLDVVLGHPLAQGGIEKFHRNPMILTCRLGRAHGRELAGEVENVSRLE